MDFRVKALDILSKVNEGYGTETFVSNGYGYFDDVTAAFGKALDADVPQPPEYNTPSNSSTYGLEKRAGGAG